MQRALDGSDLRTKASVFLTMILLSALAGNVAADTSVPAKRSWHYQLLPDSESHRRLPAVRPAHHPGAAARDV